MTADAAEEARRAALQIVEAYSTHDTERYFAGFAPDATFTFHNEAGSLDSLAAYRARWAEWEQEGFHVASCESVGGRVQIVGDDVAVWTHRVRTQLVGEPQALHERETIVLARRGGRWVAVHEHLSPDPEHP